MKWSAEEAYTKFSDREWNEVILMTYKILVGAINGGCDNITFTNSHLMLHKSGSIVAKMDLHKPFRTTSLRTAFELILLRDDIMRIHFRLLNQASEETTYQIIQSTDLPLEIP